MYFIDSTRYSLWLDKQYQGVVQNKAGTQYIQGDFIRSDPKKASTMSLDVNMRGPMRRRARRITSNASRFCIKIRYGWAPKAAVIRTKWKDKSFSHLSSESIGVDGKMRYVTQFMALVVLFDAYCNWSDIDARARHEYAPEVLQIGQVAVSHSSEKWIGLLVWVWGTVQALRFVLSCGFDDYHLGFSTNLFWDCTKRITKMVYLLWPSFQLCFWAFTTNWIWDKELSLESLVFLPTTGLRWFGTWGRDQRQSLMQVSSDTVSKYLKVQSKISRGLQAKLPSSRLLRFYTWAYNNDCDGLPTFLNSAEVHSGVDFDGCRSRPVLDFLRPGVAIRKLVEGRVICNVHACTVAFDCVYKHICTYR